METRVDGVGDLVNRLQKFDREVYKILQQEVRESSSLVANEASRLLPTGKALRGGVDTREHPSRGWGPWNRVTGGTGSVGAVTIVQGSEDLGYDGEAARRSIKVRARQYRRARSRVGIVGVVSLTNPGAVVWALMGKNPTNSRFEREVVRRYGNGPFPRALTPAWNKYGPTAGQKIDQALDRARESIGL